MSPFNVPLAALAGIKAARPGISLASRADSRGLLPQILLGQVLSARVDAVLPDGNLRVTVAGQALAMALPKYYAPGDTLELVFLAREPRLTFALTETPRAALAPVVSAAGRVIASVLPPLREGASLAGVTNAVPLLAAAPEDGAVLATKLQDTLAQSGLFYESHQAEWVAGRRELAVLLHEPQARLAPYARHEAAPEPQAGAAARGAAARNAAATDSSAPASPARSAHFMPQPLQALVQQQLAALETGKLAFQLQVWPDQWLQWEIDEDAHDAGANPRAARLRLQTRLHLDLPKLGVLDAMLAFDGVGVRVRLDTVEASTATMLQTNRAALRAALAEAGIAVLDIAVARHGQA